MTESVLEHAEHVLEAMDESGDTKVIWDSEKPEEVEAARKMFNDLKKKNYAAYRVNKKGDKGATMDSFDQDAERIIMAPQMVGG